MPLDKGTLHTAGESAHWCSHAGKLCQDPREVKNRTALLPSNHTTGSLSEEYEYTNSKAYMALSVYGSISYSSQDVEAAEVLTSTWRDKEETEYYSAVRKNEILTFAIIQTELGYYAKRSQSEKGKSHMISLICRILLFGLFF